MFIRPYHCLPSLAASIRVTGNTDVFVAPHIKNISPNYPRDVLQMFDKRNMTITRRCGGSAERQTRPGLSLYSATHGMGRSAWSPACLLPALVLCLPCPESHIAWLSLGNVRWLRCLPTLLQSILWDSKNLPWGILDTQGPTKIEDWLEQTFQSMRDLRQVIKIF